MGTPELLALTGLTTLELPLLPRMLPLKSLAFRFLLLLQLLPAAAGCRPFSLMPFLLAELLGALVLLKLGALGSFASLELAGSGRH